MNAVATDTVNAVNASTRRARLEGLVQSAIRHSFPLYTYKEFKRLVRCEYHRFVMQLRDKRTWDELSSLTGMTRAGLNKLGDTIPPTTQANAMRTLLSILQRAGADGMSLGEVASLFYAEFPFVDDAPELRQALGALLDEGLAALGDDGQYRAIASELRYSRGLTDSIVDSVIEIGERIKEGEGPERMVRFTFRVADTEGAANEAHDEMKRTMHDIANAIEAKAISEDQPTRLITIIYAGGPGAQ